MERGKYKIKKNNIQKMGLFLKDNDCTIPDNRKKPLPIRSGVVKATSKSIFAMTELAYNGHIEDDYKTYLRFNDYEITEYKRIIKK